MNTSDENFYINFSGCYFLSLVLSVEIFTYLAAFLVMLLTINVLEVTCNTSESDF